MPKESEREKKEQERRKMRVEKCPIVAFVVDVDAKRAKAFRHYHRPTITPTQWLLLRLHNNGSNYDVPERLVDFCSLS